MTNRSFRLKDEIAAKLAAAAEAEERSANWIVNRALDEYLSHREEEKIRWQETLEAMDDIDQGKTIKGERVLAWVESWGTENELPPPEPNA